MRRVLIHFVSFAFLPRSKSSFTMAQPQTHLCTQRRIGCHPEIGTAGEEQIKMKSAHEFLICIRFLGAAAAALINSANATPNGMHKASEYHSELHLTCDAIKIESFQATERAKSICGNCYVAESGKRTTVVANDVRKQRSAVCVAS